MMIVIDHHDSFVHTLARYFRQEMTPVDVIRADAFNVDEIIAQKPTAIIFSPGPGNPSQIPNSVLLVQKAAANIPMLGVCLGHQLIAASYGADIGRHPPAHGVATMMTHSGNELFESVPNQFVAGRYHSLIPDNLPETLTPIAHGPTGDVMAFKHATHPIYGVQFHPESILTPHGPQIIRNFVKITERHSITTQAPS